MKVLVVDGTYLLYRAFFTKSWDLSDAGEKTGGCFSVLRALHSALDIVNDITGVVYVWDGRRSERRKALYPEYKSNRTERKEDFDYVDFQHQQDLLNEVLPMLGVHTLRFEDREGDDVIYWTTRLAGDAVVLSDDKDMLLMLAPTVDVYRPMKEQYCTLDNFKETTGYAARWYLYLKAIIGDTSDNIKGVNGAGEKTALQFVQMLEDLGVERAKQEAAKHKSKRVRSIAEQWDVVQRNIQLLDFTCEPVDQDQLSHVFRLLTEPIGVNKQEFQTFCRKHAFASMMSDGWLSPFMKVERGRGNE